MATNMTDTDALRYSSFTTDENLTPDDFILYKDIDKDHKDMIKRYYTLKDKTFITDTEKLEMTQLLTNLEEYMITSDAFNKLCACVRTMQMFMRDGIVIFIDQQKSELIELMQSYKKVGVWNNEISYKIGNVVTYNGYSFLSKMGNNLNNTPNVEATEDDYWLRLTIKGDKGDPSLNISIKKGTDGSANYDNTIVYNTGDACVYEHRLYYALVNGIVGIVPTDNTKWACADKIVVDTKEPTDQYVIWWDTSSGNNTFKRFNNNTNIWTEQSIKGMNVSLIDNGNKFVDKNVEGALSQLATNSIPYAVTTGLANTYSATLNPAPSSYFDGMPICVKINVSSTGGSTINVNNLGAKVIKKANGSNVTNLIAGSIYTMRYNGTNFILQGEGGSGNAIPSDLRSGKTASTDNGDILGTAIEQSATTFVVSTTDQYIDSGKFLVGKQTIKGYPDLLAENIAEGKKIGDVTGVMPVGNGIGGNLLSGIPFLNIGEKIKKVVSIDNNDFIYYNIAGNKKKFNYITKTSTTVAETPTIINGYVVSGTKIYKNNVLVFDTTANDNYGVYQVTDNYTYYRGNTSYAFLNNYLPPYEIINKVYFCRLYQAHNNYSQYTEIYFTIYCVDLSKTILTEQLITKVTIPTYSGNVWGYSLPDFIYKGMLWYSYDSKDDMYSYQIYLPTVSNSQFFSTSRIITVSYLNRLQKILIYYYNFYIYEPTQGHVFQGDGDPGIIKSFPSSFGNASFGSVDIPLYNNNDTSVIPLGGQDVFKIKDFAFQTSIGETYLGFSKNFIICSSGNLYLYN